MILGSIEAGGTKFVCALGNENGEIIERAEFPTTTPSETLKKVIEFFGGKKVDGIGIGCFGPIDLDKTSETYGYITSTPKPNWANYNIVGEVKKHFDVPIVFDTDVNAAALGEAVWGNAKGLDSCLYITVGTGIGAGALIEGRLLHGSVHPEMGHIKINRHPKDTFEGNCLFHNDCLEGMAAGPAIEKRWNKKGYELSDIKLVWEIEAYYLAQALVNYILILSPKKIILGGGVMKQEQLLPLIRNNVQKMINGYVKHSNLEENIDEYIVNPGLGQNAGICGGIALALKELNFLSIFSEEFY